MPSDGALRPAEGTARPARPSRGCRGRPGLLCSSLCQLGLYENLEQETICSQEERPELVSGRHTVSPRPQDAKRTHVSNRLEEEIRFRL